VPVFDDENLVSCAGLVPVMGLAERAGLSELIAAKVAIDPQATRVASAGVNPPGKLTSIIAGMAAGADSLDDLDVIRSGGMPRLFDGVYACATLGQFLREFTYGHSLQLVRSAGPWVEAKPAPPMQPPGPPRPKITPLAGSAHAMWRWRRGSRWCSSAGEGMGERTGRPRRADRPSTTAHGSASRGLPGR
jgi:hypothetical protein